MRGFIVGNVAIYQKKIEVVLLGWYFKKEKLLYF